MNHFVARTGMDFAIVIWLRGYGNLLLSDELNNYPGQQYTAPGKDIFGCFSDTLPDRWGHTLINRREQILAKEEKRPVRHLSSFDYLVGIEDYSRMGGLRFKESLEGEYINASEALRIPPLTDIRKLIAASSEIEKVKRRFTNDRYHTLLSKRFDRKGDGKRIYFASAMTLLGLNDGDNANTGHGSGYCRFHTSELYQRGG